MQTISENDLITENTNIAERGVRAEVIQTSGSITCLICLHWQGFIKH